jgi:hypothetical protein
MLYNGQRFEDITGVIRSHNRRREEYNDKKTNYKQWSTKHYTEN